MVNFKIGDVVRVLGKPETLRTIVDVPLEYATLPWATSPSRVWLDNGGWIYITELELVYVDDPLPPAPESVMYFNSIRDEGNDQCITVRPDKDPHYVGTLCISVHPRGDYAGYQSVALNPDAALQLAHDLNRMANEIKRKEKQV